MITSLFRKLTKVSTNNFKIDFNGISDPLEICKILFLHNILFVNQLEMLSHIVVKQEVEELHMSYLNSLPHNPAL